MWYMECSSNLLTERQNVHPYFSSCCDQTPEKKLLKEERIWLPEWGYSQSITMGKAQHQEHGSVGHITPVVRTRERWMPMFNLFLPFYSDHNPKLWEGATHIFRVRVLTLINPTWKFSYRFSMRFISYMILASIQLTISIDPLPASRQEDTCL